MNLYVTLLQCATLHIIYQGPKDAEAVWIVEDKAGHKAPVQEKTALAPTIQQWCLDWATGAADHAASARCWTAEMARRAQKGSAKKDVLRHELPIGHLTSSM